MRKLIVLVIVVAALWGGYWAMAARGVNRALDAGTAALQAQGWTLDYSKRALNGFPSRLDTSFSDLRLAPPSKAVTWQAPFFQVLTLSYKPNHLIAVWPQRQQLQTYAGTYDLATSDMRASAVFQPDTSLALDHGNAVIKQPVLTLPRGQSLSAQEVRLAIRQIGGDPTRHEAALELDGFDIPVMWLQQAGFGAEAPTVLTLLRINSELTFDRPLDRTGVETGTPAVQSWTLKSLQLTWADMTLNLTGTLTPDASGALSGEATLRATHWRKLLGLWPMTEEQRARLMLALGALSPDGTTLELPVRMAQGQVLVAGLPVGPAPRLP
ncbi:DUF2125 domain-containing protein [Actibacterium sp.]|uniref:DUF2125 domain-containing protein n=1 Tax=Actibacterium sp. TaxID=1872125 RepID=UPI003564324B